MSYFKSEIASSIAKEVGIDENEVLSMISRPSNDFGDFAFPCFGVSKKLGKPIEEISDKLCKISLEFIEEIKFVKGFVNFIVKPEIYSDNVLNSIKGNFGSGFDSGKVVLEFPSPNTNKPLHLGHIRNICIGSSLFNILNFAGKDVKRVNLNNDRGISMCQAMLAYKLFGNNEEPGKYPDRLVGDYYVLFNKKVKETPELNERAQEMLKKWEEGDKEVVELWKKLNSFSLKGHKEIYSFFDVKHDKVYNESEIYKDSKKFVTDCLDKGLLEKDDKGNVIANLESFNLPNKILLRADGTSVYATQDINLARLTFKDFKPDRYLYITASEQILYFRQLLKILEILDIKNNGYHVSYGIVNLPEGRMKSREGNIVEAYDIIETVVDSAKKELEKRYDNLSSKEIDNRANKIFLGAVNFAFLSQDIVKDLTFNIEESLRFDGETGPYVQYTYARLFSVLKNSKIKSCDFSLLTEKEVLNVVKLLEDFPDVVKHAVKNYRPSSIANYVLSLVQALNSFYEKHKVNTEEDKIKEARLFFISKSLIVLKSCMELLSVPVLEEM